MTPPIDIRYQDDHLVVVAKPGGMLVHRDAHSRTFEPLLLNVVRDQIGTYLYPVHRLDRNTSGLVAFALSSEMAKALQERLQDDDAIKEYDVLVRGTTPETFASDRPLRDANGEPRPCLTEFRTVRHFDRSSLVVARLRTGRYHQIRRHLNHLGHHVLGDTTHGKGRDNQYYRDHFSLPRMFLHAYRLEFRHPRSDEPLRLHDPLHDDLKAVLNQLIARQQSSATD
ncbi:MAG: pseudouridine synthase [Planctomycetota bacterium]